MPPAPPVADERATTQLPLLRGHHPDSVIAWSDGNPISTTRLLADATTLADRLPAEGVQLNLCERRYPFLVGLFAALLKGERVVLPSSRAPADIVWVAREREGSYLLTDNGLTVDGIPQITFQPAPTETAWSGELPSISASQPVVELYTSGSSGQPTSHRKCWGELVEGARLTGQRLGLDRLTGATLVATVPPQHMFGLEASLLLPLQWGLSLTDNQPLLPADIIDALEPLPERRLLVTTPLHLKALTEAAVTTPTVAAALSATAPLPLELAERFEQQFDAPIYEVYGSTETGAIATRRTTQGSQWRPLEGVTVTAEGESWRVAGGHIERPQILHDRLELLTDGCFQLLGRKSDLIKVAGKRTSLANLNRHLQAIDGVSDGAFYLPDSATATPRLCAFVVIDGTTTRGRIVDSLRQQLDPVFLPRPLYRVESLPRNATGKLPRPALEALYRANQQSER